MTTCNRCGSKKVPWLTTWDCPNGCDAPSATASVLPKTKSFTFVQSLAHCWRYYVSGTFIDDGWDTMVLTYDEADRVYIWWSPSKEEVKNICLGAPTLWGKFVVDNVLDFHYAGAQPIARALGLPECPTKEQLLGTEEK